MSLGFIIGSLLCVIGFAGFFAVLGRAGALAKSKQLGALARILRGEAGAFERSLLVLALTLCLVGACFLFMTVAQQDAAVRDACVAACRQGGLPKGRIARSHTGPVRACFCGEGDAAHELYVVDPGGQTAPASAPPP